MGMLDTIQRVCHALSKACNSLGSSFPYVLISVNYLIHLPGARMWKLTKLEAQQASQALLGHLAPGDAPLFRVVLAEWRQAPTAV